MKLKQDALSTDVATAVPFSTATQKPWKDTLRSVLNRRSYLNNNDIIVLNPRGLFGDQPCASIMKQKKKNKKKEAQIEGTNEGDDDNVISGLEDCNDNEDQGREDKRRKKAARRARKAAKEKAATEAKATAEAEALLAEGVALLAEGAAAEEEREKAAAKRARKAARKAAKKALQTEVDEGAAAPEQAPTNTTNSTQPKPTPSQHRPRVTPARQSRRSRGHVDSDSSKAMLITGGATQAHRLPCPPCFVGAGGRVEGNWGKEWNFWNGHTGTITSGVFNATKAHWEYQILWDDKSADNKLWAIGENKFCIRILMDVE